MARSDCILTPIVGLLQPVPGRVDVLGVRIEGLEGWWRCGEEGGIIAVPKGANPSRVSGSGVRFKEGDERRVGGDIFWFD